MRYQVTCLLAASLFLPAGPAMAETKPELELSRKAHKLVQTTVIRRGGNGWLCVTEQTRFPLARAPLSILKEAAKLGAAKPSRCDDQVEFRLRGSKLRQLCAEDTAAKDFLARLARLCGR